MRTEIIFDLFEAQRANGTIAVGNQIGYLQLFENSSMQTSAQGVTGKVRSSHSWVLADMNTVIQLQGSAVFDTINTLRLANQDHGGDMYIEIFNFDDPMDENTTYNIYELKNRALSYQIRYKTKNISMMFLPGSNAKKRAVA